MGVPPPAVPESMLEGWRLREDREEVPFRAGAISVRAHTLVYEDAERRRQIREAVGTQGDTVWRFYFASRLRIVPRVPASAVLTRIVESNATSQFETQLRERGFESVERAGRRTLDIEGSTARVARFEAIVPGIGGVDVAAEAHLAVAPGDREYVLAGGAYPTEVIGSGGAEGTPPDIERFLRPDADRDALVRLIRSTR
ncbi:MAG: hypothetical protein V5A46_07915 [Haloferacaceae archaeon]